jgi:hypothetical protein
LVESHAWHASPPKPHDAKDRPLQVGPEQHPVAQVEAQPLHVPLLQVSPPGHVWHCVPPLPQAPTLFPVWHVPLEQHPLGHETPSHWHDPFRHLCPTAHAPPVPHLQAPSVHESAEPGVHAAHACPTAAHDVSDGVVQVVPSQQPFGHDVASHAQTPATQCSPALHGPPVPQWQTPVDEQLSEATASQLTQVDPAAPHIASDRALHVDPAQQPLGHEVASQTHRPPAHRCPSAHAG